MPDCPVVALDIGVLLGLAGLDVGPGDALMRFSRRFSSSKTFIWLIMDASMPADLARHLLNVALLIPC